MIDCPVQLFTDGILGPLRVRAMDLIVGDSKQLRRLEDLLKQASKLGNILLTVSVK